MIEEIFSRHARNTASRYIAEKFFEVLRDCPSETVNQYTYQVDFKHMHIAADYHIINDGHRDQRKPYIKQYTHYE